MFFFGGICIPVLTFFGLMGNIASILVLKSHGLDMKVKCLFLNQTCYQLCQALKYKGQDEKSLKSQPGSSLSPK